MLSKRDLQEIKSLRAIRDAWRSAPIRCITGRLCGVEYDIRREEDLDELLEPFSDI